MTGEFNMEALCKVGTQQQQGDVKEVGGQIFINLGLVLIALAVELDSS